MTQKERNVQAKDWLNQYRYAKKEWIRRNEELEELISIQESTGAIEYSDMPKAMNTEQDLSDLMVRRDAYMTRVIKARTEMDRAFDLISGAIAAVDKLEYREVLTLRYLRLNGSKRMSWDEIADRMGYSVDYVWRLHGIALYEISQKITENNRF